MSWIVLSIHMYIYRSEPGSVLLCEFWIIGALGAIHEWFSSSTVWFMARSREGRKAFEDCLRYKLNYIYQIIWSHHINSYHISEFDSKSIGSSKYNACQWAKQKERHTMSSSKLFADKWPWPKGRLEQFHSLENLQHCPDWCRSAVGLANRTDPRALC